LFSFGLLGIILHMQNLRINFNQIFNFHPDGTIAPKASVRVGGVKLGSGVKLGRGIKVGGRDLFEWSGKDLSVTQDGDTWAINGYYE